jgi:hypothetical protein
MAIVVEAGSCEKGDSFLKRREVKEKGTLGEIRIFPKRADFPVVGV